MMMRYRLAVLTSHPVQYQAPLFRKLAQNSQIDLTVYYCSDFGVTEKVDPGFGISIKWDIPLLEGYTHRFLKNYASRPSPSRFWGLINPGIIRKLRRERYDAILIHGYALATNWLAFLGAWVSGTPVFFRGETVLRPNRPWWIRVAKRILLSIMFRRTVAFLTIGSKSHEFYKSFGISDDRIFFTPYAVDNDFFISRSQKWRVKKDSLKTSLGIPESMPVFLFVGKLIERKRPFDLLYAYEGMGNKAGLIFVGDGSLRPKLEQYVKEKGLSRVFFVGFKNQSELPKHYALADIFVLPSSSQEVSPLVINEALCCGLPIITTDAVPSSIDFVRHEENGFIYPVGDIEALAGYLNELLANPERCQKMGQRSLEIISTWNYDACVDGILKALEYVTQGKG